MSIFSSKWLVIKSLEAKTKTSIKADKFKNPIGNNAIAQTNWPNKKAKIAEYALILWMDICNWDSNLEKCQLKSSLKIRNDDKNKTKYFKKNNWDLSEEKKIIKIKKNKKLFKNW